ncbi:MAG: hypothetical protein NZ805_01030 [Armatimonadetes bacterium]|nr:hypothetical protein [Armatimonadota bacterium]MDW8028360.1 hypothetical protein [Armatimonadota bacterium]
MLKSCQQPWAKAHSVIVGETVTNNICANSQQIVRSRVEAILGPNGKTLKELLKGVV